MRTFLKSWFEFFIAFSIIFSFYWFEWRLHPIRIECNDSAFRSSVESEDKISFTQIGRMELKEKFYYDCLRYQGLEK